MLILLLANLSLHHYCIHNSDSVFNSTTSGKTQDTTKVPLNGKQDPYILPCIHTTGFETRYDLSLAR